MFDDYYLERYVTVSAFDPIWYRKGSGFFCVCADGRVFVAFSKGYSTDVFEACAGKLSTNNGESWGEEFLILDRPDICDCAGVCFVDGTRIILSILRYVSYTPNPDAKCQLIHSDNYGDSWSEPVDLPSKTVYQLLGMNYIKMQDGTRIITGSYDTLSPLGSWTSHIWRCDAEDDPSVGTNWVLGGDVPKGSASHLDEPSVVEIAGGNLLMLMRTPNGYLYKSISTNKGVSWSTAVSTGLQSPSAPCEVLRLSWSPNRIVVVWNNSGLYRFPLSIAMSVDDGVTWGVPSVITNPQHNVAYPTSCLLPTGKFIVGWWDSISYTHETCESCIIAPRGLPPPPAGKNIIGVGFIGKSAFSQSVIF